MLRRLGIKKHEFSPQQKKKKPKHSSLEEIE
jgi:hypothetical protein